MSPALGLQRAARRLLARLDVLEARLDAEEAAWGPYVETAHALALVLAQLEPTRSGALLTTEQMAERLGMSPKTLLKHKARGAIRPVVAKGKLLRWNGREGLR